MPMGLKNAPSFLQRMMEDVLFTADPELRAFVSVYIDDIIIATEGQGLTDEELVALHEKQLDQVMDILDANQLICGPKKRKLFFKFCRTLWFSSREWYTPTQSREARRYSEVETPCDYYGIERISRLLQFLPHICAELCKIPRPPH